MKRDWVVEGDEESQKAYAMIDSTNQNWVRLYAHHSSVKEKIMSIETVRENRKKIVKICVRIRMREAMMTRSTANE